MVVAYDVVHPGGPSESLSESLSEISEVLREFSELRSVQSCSVKFLWNCIVTLKIPLVARYLLNIKY